MSMPVRILIVLSFMLSLTSCFQVIEEITLKNNGSGDMQITMNLSQSKSKLASLMLLDSVNGYKIPKEKDIQQFMNETVDFLKKSKGITNIKKTVDLKNYIASVSFSFKDLSDINGITKKLLEKEKAKAPENSYAFDKAAGRVKRTYQHSPEMKQAYNKLKQKDKEVFKNAGFTSIFRFENAIASSSNKAAKISASGKAIMLKTTATDLIFGVVNISNNIQLAR
ncbi:MAG: hypothetical protein H7X88_01925 [Gloeobacteraceae cyanobacterium ES-bin-316]|nr:hypothetical protein [Ferruginibacter sp.]